MTAVSTSAHAAGLEDELGRSEVRIRAEAYPLVAGRTVADCALLERLDRLGYERVRRRPTSPGTFFFGHDVFWIYRRAHRDRGKDFVPTLIGLRLRRSDGMILGAVGPGDTVHALDTDGLLWLEPETIAESLAGDRADRIRVRLDDLPEHVWRPVLAAEDARFFQHVGVDARAVARAALANIKKGGVVQGGSTITQQLIKNRDLTPKRSIGRKASEAARALALEADYDKREILQAYLNQVYLGHMDGLSIHGFGTGARAYFSKPAAKLTLAEAALLAAIIQGPNRLSPIRHPERARERRDWVLSRMEDEGWAKPEAIRHAKGAGLGLRPSPPERSSPRQFLSWVSAVVEDLAGDRLDKGRGVVVETTLDPLLQRTAEDTVTRQLGRLRRGNHRLRGAGLSAALVALDSRTGAVLAYVGGDPTATDDAFDRARRAKRQPGSAVKPFILLEAFGGCGSEAPLSPASRVADEPLRIELPSGPWEPENADRTYHGVIDVRTALAESRNVPMTRIARWCGFDDTARMFRRAGLDLPEDPPPSYVLGSVEATPLEIARAHTVIANRGRRLEPFPVLRVETPGGRAIGRFQPRERRVARPATAFLVRDAMRSAVARGTARVADIDGLDVAAKTGTSSELRDAWFAGHAGSIVTVVWVGLDDGSPLGLTGAKAAGPIWRDFMAAAVPARPRVDRRMPRGIVEKYVDPETGLLVRERHRRARKEIFRRDALPPRARFWKADRPVPVVR